MASKIIIALSSNYKITIKPINFNEIKNSLKDKELFFIKLLKFITEKIFPIYTLLIFFLPSLTDKYNYSILLQIHYSIILILMFVEIFKLILTKNKVFQFFPFDIYILTFTTLLSLVFFINTAVLNTITNVWGGNQLNSISAISIISYVFLYYFFYIYTNSKTKISSIINTLKLSPFISLILILIFNLGFNSTSLSLLGILFPSLLVFSIYEILKGKFKIINIFDIFNLLFSLYIVLFHLSRIEILIICLTSLLIFTYLIISKRKKIFNIFNNFNLKKNNLLLFFLSSIFLFGISFFAFFNNYNINEFISFNVGLSLINNVKDIEVFVGKGYDEFNNIPLALNIIRSYGFLLSTTLLILLIIIGKNLKNIYCNTKNADARIIIKSLIIGVFSSIIYLILSPINNSILIIFLIISISLILVINNVYNNKKNSISEFTLEKRSFPNLTEEKIFFLDIFKTIIILLLIFLLIYLLSSLNYINIFISALI